MVFDVQRPTTTRTKTLLVLLRWMVWGVLCSEQGPMFWKLLWKILGRFLILGKSWENI